MAKLTCYMIMVGLLSGCVGIIAEPGSPYHISIMSDEELQQAKAINLCFAYATQDHSDSKIEAELLRRGVFSEKEWRAIRAHKIFIGMSESAFRCSWYFNPIFLTNVRSVREGSWGVRKVFLYIGPDRNAVAAGRRRFNDDRDLIPGRWPKTVYVENGVIVAYQESRTTNYRDCVSWSRKDACFEFDSVVTTEDSVALMR